MLSNSSNRASANLAWESSTDGLEIDPDELSLAAAGNDAWGAFAANYSGLTADAPATGGAEPLTTLYSAQWTTTAGTWETAANWTVTDPGEPAHSVPGVNDVVGIGNNGSLGYTITYNSTDTIAAIKTGTAVTLSMQSGSLIARFGGTIDDELDVASGTTLGVGVGYTLDVYKGSISGKVIGRGELDLFGGAHTLDTNYVTVGALEVGSGTTTLDMSLGYSGDFQLAANAILNLNGNLLNLRGSANLNGSIAGAGTVNVVGSATLGNTLLLNGASLVDCSGATITQDGQVLIGRQNLSPASLTVAKGATYEVVNGTSLGNGYPTRAPIKNSGLMTVIDNSKLILEATFTNYATATIAIDAGSTFDLNDGTAVLNGTISGTGTLEVSTIENALLYTANVSVAEILITGGVTTLETTLSYSGSWQLDGASAVLKLNGKTLTLTSGSNSLVASAVTQGTIDVTGTVTQLSGIFGTANGGPVRINDNGTIDQAGNVTLDGSIVISNNNVYEIASGSYLSNSAVGVSSVIYNSGSFIRDSSAGPFFCGAKVTNNGQIVAESGSLTFSTTISGSGHEVIDAGAYLGLSAQTASQTVQFNGANAELGLSDASIFQSNIFSFGAAADDAIDLIGFASNATKSIESVAGGVIVNIADGNHTASLKLAGNFNQSGFQLNTGSNGELLTYSD